MPMNGSYRILTLVLVTLPLAPALRPQIPEEDRHQIDQIIDVKGALIAEENVYKIILPNEAATIVQHYQSLPPTFGLNSWAAFSPAKHHEALMTGAEAYSERSEKPAR